MRPPSLIEHLLGNWISLLAILVALIHFGLEYFTGAEDRIVFLILLGFLLFWSDGARRRRTAWRQWNRGPEEAPRKATVPRRGPWRRIVGWSAAIAGAIAATPFVWAFADGFQQFYTGRPLPPLASFLPAMPRGVTAAFANASAWLTEFSMFDAAVLALAIVACAVLIRRARRRRQRAVAPAIRAKWDGTVQVVVPVPKK